MTLYDWYVLSKAFSKEECLDLYNFCISNKSEVWKDSPAPGKKADTFVVETGLFDRKLDRLFDLVRETNNNYFGYDLFKERPLGVNVNVYEGALNEYPYHRDCNFPGTACDSKLTVILNISPEPYEGGEFFIFMGEDKLVENFNHSGSLLIFPSFMFHKVAPVTKGKRVSISMWLQGPNFK